MIMSYTFRKTAKIVVCILLCAAALMSVACSGKKQTVSRKEAQNIVESFFDALADNKTDKAISLLHPSGNVVLDEYMHLMKNNYKIDLQRGIIIDNYTGYTAVNYDSSVKGAYAEISANILSAEGERAVLVVRVVENEEGRGIYSFSITKK